MWNAQEASYGPPATGTGVEEWASKHGDKNYALEVAQHPVRARMCGFGDKDRRPLAPAAIARLIVTDSNNVPVPPESIQVAFFIVLVDLWDEAGRRENNLVRVPLPTGITSRRYKVQRADSLPASQRRNGTGYSFSDPQVTQGGASRDLPAQPSFSPTHQRVSSNGSSVKRRRNGSSIDDADPTRGLIRVESDNGLQEVPTQPFYPQQDTTAYPADYTPPDLMPFNSFFPSYPVQAPGMGYPSAVDNINSVSAEVADPSSYPSNGDHGYLNSQPQPWQAEEPAEYARTLIGPLAAGAQTLNDDNDEPGIFFLFQDLSVRTEGVFRLRMRLVNVGGPPAPDPGASYVRSDNSTVLAQVFTDPFTVYSPKKFPGVPSPTPLSQRLLQQGLKIPGRTRFPNGKGPANSRRKRRKTDTEEWQPGEGAASNSDEE